MALFVTLSSFAVTQLREMPELISRTVSNDVPTEIIYEAPEGEERFYEESYESWVFWGAEFGLQYFNGTNTNSIVWCDNNEVYIKNPVISYATNSYAKGIYADGKIRIELPQCIGQYYDEFNNIQYMYLNKLEEVEQDGEKYYMICYPEDNFVEYKVDENGNIELDLGNSKDYDIENGINPKNILGLTYSNDPHTLQVWSGYGDAFETWKYMDDSNPVYPPEDAEFKKWAFETREHKTLIEVAIDGDDIYVNGLNSYTIGVWFKGIIKDDKIVFPSKQFLCKNEWNQFLYFMAAEIYVEEGNEWNQYQMIDQVTMVYNPETNVYKAQEGEVFVISTSNESLAFLAMAENPSLWEQDPEKSNAAPLNPSLYKFEQLDPETNVCVIKWIIPNENINGNILAAENMYYNLYIDGEKIEFTSEDSGLFTENTYDIPYGASDYLMFSTFYDEHTFNYDSIVNESIGIQSFYKGEDDNVYASELITHYINGTDIEDVEYDKVVVNVEYISLSGIVTNNPGKGFYVKRTMFDDGTNKIEKVMLQ